MSLALCQVNPGSKLVQSPLSLSHDVKSEHYSSRCAEGDGYKLRKVSGTHVQLGTPAKEIDMVRWTRGNIKISYSMSDIKFGFLGES